jgi:ATP-binding cassette, subfamily C (CFTR/MRP), member 1
VDLLPFADHIIALNKQGAIIQQGTFNSLNNVDGYIQSFGIQKFQEIGTESTNENTISVLKGKKLPLVEELLIDSSPIQSNRPTGDFSVYRFYFKTIGDWHLLLFFLTSCVFAFFFVFPSKPSPLFSNYSLYSID